MNFYTIVVTCIFCIKIVYIFLRAFIVLTPHTTLNLKSMDALNITAFKLEFIFIFSMSLLLIYTFCRFANRNNTMIIDREARLLFFTFGIVLIISAKWDLFFKKNIIWSDIQKIIN